MLDKDKIISPATLLRDARKKLVQKYLEHPGSFPDGIEDRKGEQWYTPHKDHWHKLAKDESPDDESHTTESQSHAAESHSGVEPPWEKLGISRASYYRKKTEGSL